MLTSEINMLKAKVLDLAEKYQNVEFTEFHYSRKDILDILISDFSSTFLLIQLPVELLPHLPVELCHRPQTLANTTTNHRSTTNCRRRSHQRSSPLTMSKVVVYT
ncbi:unnamed protein product [Lactuca saligna]|uniref:Uncharacterized protein n=1 Tax=Lactuca saligna TaxID=75948 RepID=A0AA35YJW6_LACSI|nr:unnamed protein product [Lactuca saligna]